MDGKARSINRIADRALEASAEVVQALACPRCGGALQIQYVELANARSRKTKSLYVGCQECGWRVISDGLPKQPPWVEKLGAKITTNALHNAKT